MRERPSAFGSQQPLQRGQPVEVLEVGQGARLCPRAVVGQTGEQGVVVGRVRWGLLDQVEPERPAAAGGGQHRPLHPLEPVLVGQEALVGKHRRQVRVGQQEPADLPGRRDQPERRPGDDRHLPEPGPHGVEQSWVAGRR
jgi:hypothetical protein